MSKPPRHPLISFTAVIIATMLPSAVAADLPTLLPAASLPSATHPTSAQALPTSQPDNSTRESFLSLIDRPRVALDARETSGISTAGITTVSFSYASEATQRVPGILLCRDELLTDLKQHPVVIVLHGTGGSKVSELATLKELAEKGFIAVSIDGRYHGDRGSQADYNAAIAKAYDVQKTHPLYFDTVWDVMRLIDYLQIRKDVDPKRIGLMGISKGGIETWLTAAADTRVTVAIPCISVQSFAWGLAHDGWHGRVGTVQKGFDEIAREHGIQHPDAVFVQSFYDHLIPGIYSKYDGPQMLPLIAPRPLLVISGDKDPINPLEGEKLCEQATAPVYAKLNAADHFKVVIEADTGHAVTKAAHAQAIAWFEKWLLKP